MQGQTNRKIRDARLQHQLRDAPALAEHLLWQHLRIRQLESCKFRRQHPFIDSILDFVCIERALVVELDGSQHVGAVDYDARRIVVLEKAGFIVLRFWNNDVLEKHGWSAGSDPANLAQQSNTIPTQPSP